MSLYSYLRRIGDKGLSVHATAFLGGIQQARLSRVSGKDAGQFGIRVVPGANRSASAVGQAAKRAWDRDPGARGRFRWRHLQGCLRRAVQGSGLRVACISKEIETRCRDAQERSRPHRKPAEGRREPSRRLVEGERTMTRKLNVTRGSNNIFADLGRPDAE